MALEGADMSITQAYMSVIIIGRALAVFGKRNSGANSNAVWKLL